jgi:hypothetical protein
MQKNMTLLSITNEKIDGKDGVNIILSTGGVGLPSLESMVSTFEKYNGDSKLEELSTFIIELNVKKIMIYATDRFSSYAALFIFAKLCKKLDVYCVAYTTQPNRYSGRFALLRFNGDIETIKPIVNELYVINDDMMEEPNKQEPVREYNSKYIDVIDKYVLEKFMINKTDNQGDESTEDKTPKTEEIAYERHIGKQFETKGDLVIYNGLIKDYGDGGVDLTAISPDGKTLNLIQCKSWHSMAMGLFHIQKIYQKLTNHNFDFLNLPIEQIKTHLHTKKDEKTIRDIITNARQNKNNFTIRKTLYIASEKVVDLEIGKHLIMIQPDIFRYEDMKIVVERI